MKKIYVLFTLIAMLAIAFVSCNKDEDLVAPTITVSPTTADAYVGDTVSFSATVAGDQELIDVKVTASSVGAAGTSSDTTFEKGKHSATISYDYVVPTGVTTVTLTFLITDKENLSDTATAVITVQEREDDYLLYSAIIMGGMSNTDVGSFLEVATGTVMTPDDVEAEKVDVVFTYSGTNGNLFAAPSDAAMIDAFDDVANLATKNETLFTEALSDVDFDAIVTAAEIEAPFVDAGLGRINNTAVDDVFGIKTVNDKYALIKVVEILGTTAADRGIKIDVKVQK